MQRSELEHIIRASGDVAQDDEIVIIGSQSILGQFPDAPIRLLASMEADVYPRHHPERADKVDGAIGGIKCMLSPHAVINAKGQMAGHQTIARWMTKGSSRMGVGK